MIFFLAAPHAGGDSPRLPPQNKIHQKLAEKGIALDLNSPKGDPLEQLTSDLSVDVDSGEEKVRIFSEGRFRKYRSLVWLIWMPAMEPDVGLQRKKGKKKFCGVENQKSMLDQVGAI